MNYAPAINKPNFEVSESRPFRGMGCSPILSNLKFGFGLIVYTLGLFSSKIKKTDFLFYKLMESRYVSPRSGVNTPPGSRLSSRLLWATFENNLGGNMGVLEILSSIDREIALLKRARVLLAGGGGAAPRKRRGRPRKASAAAAKPARKKRRLSAEGRRRIAEAVRRRWAKQKKAAGK